MKAIVVTTITTILDIDKMQVQGHIIDIDDQDGLNGISPDVLGALVVGGMTKGLEACYERWPRLKPDDVEPTTSKKFETNPTNEVKTD